MVFVFAGISLGKGQVLPSSVSQRPGTPHGAMANTGDCRFLVLRGFGGSWPACYTKALLLLRELIRAGLQISSRSTPKTLASRDTPEVIKHSAAVLKTDSRNWDFPKCSFFAVPGSSPWLPSHRKWQSYMESILFQSGAAWNVILAATGVFFLFGSCHSQTSFHNTLGWVQTHIIQGIVELSQLWPGCALHTRTVHLSAIWFDFSEHSQVTKKPSECITALTIAMKSFQFKPYKTKTMSVVSEKHLLHALSTEEPGRREGAFPAENARNASAVSAR